MTEQRRVAVVTGAGHGIGASCARRLADDGFAVLVADRDGEAATAIAAELAAARAQTCDVADPSSVQALAEVASTLGTGHVDALVNAAGVTSRASFADCDADAWQAIQSVNLHGVIEVTRSLLPGLLAAHGAIVSISSVAGLVGVEGLASYSATKAALIALTRSLALELGAQIRVNAVAPGDIATRMMARIVADPELHRASIRRIPAGRFGRPEEVADVVAWLLSGRASYVNGVVIPVDGGLSAGYRSIESVPAAPS